MKRSEDAVSNILLLQPQIRLTRTQRKIIEVKNEIYFQPQPDADDMAFSARELVQATLPHQTPKGNPPVWSRVNGNYPYSDTSKACSSSTRIYGGAKGLFPSLLTTAKP